MLEKSEFRKSFLETKKINKNQGEKQADALEALKAKELKPKELNARGRVN